jgi:hypothetical protein
MVKKLHTCERTLRHLQGKKKREKTSIRMEDRVAAENRQREERTTHQQQQR